MEFANAGVYLDEKSVNLIIDWTDTFEALETLLEEANYAFTFNDKEYTDYDELTYIQRNYYFDHRYTIILNNKKTPSDALEEIAGKTITYTDAVELRKDIEAIAALLPDESATKHTWIFPKWSGASVSYAVGDRVSYADLLYKCIITHTSQVDWTPDTAVSLWVRVDDPAIEFPDWRQPSGAHDAYNTGDKVSHLNKHWISDIDANVYEPSVYGWTEVE